MSIINVNAFLNKVLRFVVILIGSYFFWILADVSNYIYTEINNRNDMFQYYAYYKQNNNINFSEIFLIHNSDRVYFVLTYFLNKLGISFEFFLFSLIFSLFFLTHKLFSQITLSNSFIYLMWIILFSSFWAQSLLLVTLKQGFAYLIIVYFLFKREKIGFFKKLIIILLAANIHGSAIIFIPYILIENKALKNIKFIEVLFIFFLLGHFLNMPVYYAENVFNLLNYFDIDSRSLMFFEQENTSYKLGFSFYKFLAFGIPLLTFKLANYKKTNLSILIKRIYVYYLYSIMLGIFFSGFIFHDRLFLYGWAITPVLLVYATLYQKRIILSMRDLFKQSNIN